MNKHIGSSFDDFLEDEGILEESAEIAAKRVLAWKIEQARKRKKLSKKKLAQAMKVSDTQLLRLLDPDNTSVTLHTMTRAASALGMRVEIDLVEDRQHALHNIPA
jgi:transcriptional regulator with XRE-family HTH domain